MDLKIIVTGKVQGVWFRVKTKEKADGLKLSGLVKNQDDGTVYIEVSGKNNHVYELISWAQDGPELSKVERVCIKKNNITHKDEFKIER